MPIRRRRRRNVPLTHAERDALERILFSHRNDVRNPRRVRRSRFGKHKRVIRRRRRAASMHPHRLFAEEWAKIRTIRASHTARKRAAQASLNRGVAAEAGAGVNPPKLLRRWTTAAEWRMVKHGREAASVPVNIGDQILGSHYRNPRQIIRRRGKRYVRITNRAGRQVAKFRIKRSSRRGRTPRHLKRYLFKKGHRVSAAIRRKARAGWLRWRRAQLAKRRRVHHKRRAVRRVHHKRRTHKRYVFTAARRRALAKARRARR